MKSKTVVNAAVLVGAAVVVCVLITVLVGGVKFPGSGGDDSGDDEALTMRGTVKLTGGAFGPNDGTGHCGGVAGFDDITAGSSVVVHDQAGKVIGTGVLGVSAPGDYFDGGSNGEKIPASCGFPFEVPKVPDADFYGVAVGHRNTVTFTRDQVRTGLVELKLSS